MRKIKRLTCVLLLVITIVQCQSLQKVNNNSFEANTKTNEIYLVIGQSNMAGRAKIEEQDKDSLKNVFLYTGDVNKLWEKAANPMNKYSTVRKKLEMQKLGPTYVFANELSKNKQNKKIGLVVNAKGGTSIEDWREGGILYKEAVHQTKEALKFGVLKGIIWHQGESDSSKHKSYLPKIIALITSLRDEFKSPNLPVIVGQLSLDKPKRKKFNKMILDLPNKINNVSVVSSEGLTTIDKTHFDSKSQRVLGERYAKEMMVLLNEN